MAESTADDPFAPVYAAWHTFGRAAPGVSLALPAFGADSALLGAAEVGFTALLADPH